MWKVVSVIMCLCVLSLGCTEVLGNDSDNDGIDDAEDFFDEGNGVVVFSIRTITSTACDDDGYCNYPVSDFWSQGDPVVVFHIDLNEDSLIQDAEIIIGDTHQDDEDWSGLEYIYIDVPDDKIGLTAEMLLLEEDETEYEEYDISPDNYYSYTTQLAVGDYAPDGSMDMNSEEPDMKIEYSISYTDLNAAMELI